MPVLRILSLSFTVMVFGHLSQHLLSAHALLGRLVGITLAGAAVRVVLLALLIPTLGLVGAATAAAIAMALEQSLMVATALRQFRVKPRLLLLGIWRPGIAAVTMAGVLAGTGLGWSDDPGVPGLITAIAVGAATYGLVLIAAWILTGRPEGPETDLLSVLRMRSTQPTRRKP